MRTTRILYVCSALKRSGPTNQLLNIVSNLPENCQATVCTLSPEPEESMMQEYIARGIRVHSLGLGRVEGMIYLRHRFKQFIEQERPDVIHSQGVRSDFLSVIAAPGTKKVATLRNYPQFDYPMTYGGFVGAMLTRWHLWSLQRMTKVVGVSTGVLNNIKGNFGVQHSEVVLNGVETKTYFPIDSGSKSDMRSKLAIEETAEVWISVGHLSERKDPLRVIKSFKAYCELNQSKNVQLLMVGNGNLRKECEKQAKDVNIKIVGRVSNVVEYLQASDFFISASTAEGFPNSVLESLACGIPVVLSDIEPHAEFSNMDSNIVKLFSDNDECVSQMQALSLSDKGDLKQRTNQVVSTHLSAVVMAKRYSNIYQELLNL